MHVIIFLKRMLNYASVLATACISKQNIRFKFFIVGNQVRRIYSASFCTKKCKTFLTFQKKAHN